jgi:ABC-2 type transport system ATP-binding protein
MPSDAARCPTCRKLQPELPVEFAQPHLATIPLEVTPEEVMDETHPQTTVQSRVLETRERRDISKTSRALRERVKQPVPLEAPRPMAVPVEAGPRARLEQSRPTYEPNQILVVRNLSVVKSKKRLVQGIDFAVGRGEIVGILGPSGSGKSTIIKVLTTEFSGASGQVIMGGFDLFRQVHPAKQLFGYVPQDIQLYEDLTFGQNVMYFGGQYGLDKAYLLQKAQSLATVVELGDRLNDKVGRLSGGQKKRVSVAAALVHDPELVILDEPTSGLDPATRRSLWKFLKSINQTYNVSLVVTTHYLDEGEYCDKLLIISKGRMIVYDSPRNLKENVPGAGKVIELEMFTLDDYVSSRLAEFESRAKKEGVAELVDRSGYKVKIFCKDTTKSMAMIPILLGELGLGFKSMNVVDTSLEDVFMYFTGEAFREEV